MISSGIAKNTDRLFGVVFEIQKEQIESHCWGKGCGKGHIGAVHVGPATLITCSEENCPIVAKQIGDPIGDVNGRPIFLRRLKEAGER